MGGGIDITSTRPHGGFLLSERDVQREGEREGGTGEE